MEKDLKTITTIEEVKKYQSKILEDRNIMSTVILLDSKKPRGSQLVPEFIHQMFKPNSDGIDLNEIKYWLYKKRDEEKKHAIYQLLLEAIKNEANIKESLAKPVSKSDESEKTMTMEDFIRKELAAGRENPFPGFPLEDNHDEDISRTR